MRRRAVFLCGLLALLPAAAQTIEQRSDARTGSQLPPYLDAAGQTLAFPSSADPLGSNPDHAFQLFFWETSGNLPTQLTADRTGGALSASVSDDGQRFAFAARGDLAGGNPDQSAEIFVILRDGSDLRQLTSATVGSSAGPVISGDGGTILFTSSADLTGGNADHSNELFAIDWDGSNLRQLTASAGDAGAGHLSDDGTRVVFASSQDPLGTNADLNAEIFSILSDGSGLAQLTATVDASNGAPWIAGDGSRIAFQSDGDLTGSNADLGDEIFLIDWGGGGLTQLTDSQALLGESAGSSAPSMDDAASIVVFHSNQVRGLTNFDSNFEIWKIDVDGSGLDPLTSSAIDVGSLLPRISGDGSRVGYVSLTDPLGSNGDGNLEVFSVSIAGTNRLQHGQSTWGFAGGASLGASSPLAAFGSSADLTGGNADLNGELFTVNLDSGLLTQVTSTTGGGLAGGVGATAIRDDGSLIVFDSTANPTGGNLDGSREIFRVDPDGANLAQLTAALLSDSSGPRLSADGNWIVFESDADPTGGNPDNSGEIFAMRSDGTDLRQLSAAATGSSDRPSVSADGSRVVFDSSADLLPGGNPELNREIFAVGIDGGGLTQLTSSAAGSSSGADLRRDGLRVVFASSADLTGGNGDGNTELFAIDYDGTNLAQLTATTGGGHGAPRWAPDGSSITFGATAPYAGPNPDGRGDLWRTAPDGSGLQRLTAVHLGSAGAAALDEDGSRLVTIGIGDFTGDNPDQLPELFSLDLDAPWRLELVDAQPTRWAWGARVGAYTYDVARGDLAALGFGAGVVDLGPLTCVEADSPDLDTLGFEDPDLPTPGSGFFYVVRGDDGLQPPTYGAASGGEPRQPGAGDCP